MNYAEVLNHEPTAATVAMLDKLNEYVQQRTAEHPEIPESVYWDDICEILTAEIDKRAEG